MQGFDYEKARNHLEIPDNFDVMVIIAVGKKGPKDNQLIEKPLAEFVMEGQFKNIVIGSIRVNALS